MAPEPTAVARALLAHYGHTKRDMPWRQTRDPYAIWISEIMLQQTRVATVIAYYERWLQRFPTLTALAQAPVDDVLSAWAGLGYYSRARNLHKGAREVVERYGGQLPSTAEQLRTLPGIGRYTAGAISSIAFNQQEPVVDGNVLRVLSRVYEIDTPIKSSATQREIWELARQLVPAEAPGDFNQALMELGATLCTPSSPSCLLCPLGGGAAGLCGAAAAGRQQELPVTSKRTPVDQLPVIDATAVWIQRRKAVLLVRRHPNGLYGGMWELPWANSAEQLSATVGLPVTVRGERPAARHEQQLSHRRFRIEVWPALLGKGRVHPDSARYDLYRWQPLEHLTQIALSTAMRSIVKKYQSSTTRSQ